MSEAKHTPTPWHLDGRYLLGSYYTDADGDDVRLHIAVVPGGVSDDEEQKANAAFIVRAVNNFDEMVRALEAAEASLEEAAEREAKRPARGGLKRITERKRLEFVREVLEKAGAR